MKWASWIGVWFLLAGCAMKYEHSVCAPKEMVEECLNEVAQGKEPPGAMGPNCRALVLWAKANDWGVGYLPVLAR